ncbi:GGDEF domain-containing protein [Aquabacter sp. CN5-332]|uniref:GGDEF domain-containing protein n=1 Tax=Aquabacter sp. CN5-332 TaxID=3156608 RepID=UPI0032B55967
MLDFTSLLLSVCLSTAGVSAVLFSAWLSSQRDGFLLTCAVGAVMVGLSGIFSAFYAQSPQVWLVTGAYVLLLSGLATIYGTAWQFRNDASPWRVILWAAGLTIGVTVPFHLLGYNGIGFVVGFLSAAVLNFLTAFNFWKARSEAPGTLITLTVFYSAIALSLLVRASLVAMEGRAIMPGPPQNWAQTLSLALAVAVVPVLGALTFSLNQKRLIRDHRQQALTDPLTGLPNRRALFESVAAFTGTVALVVFDIDRFKAINDSRGHGMGDEVIALFARTLRRHIEPGQVIARLGGEEFVLVCPRGDIAALGAQAERLRHDFAERVSADLHLECAASGGIACGEVTGDRFTRVMAAADKALYRAKRLGRDRLVVAEKDMYRLAPAKD